MRTRSTAKRRDGAARYVNAFWAGAHIVLLSRDDDGELVREVAPVEHVSFIRRAAFDAHPNLRTVLEASRHVAGWREDGAFIRIQWHQRDKCIDAASKKGWFAQHGIEVFEADVDPVRRYVTDHDIEIQRPRRCYVDLETDDRVSFAEMPKMRILCWSCVSEDGTRRASGVLGDESLDAERVLLKALFEELRQYDQVCAWNGERFDFRVIEHRLAAVGLAVELRRWLLTDQMKVFERFDKASAESGEEKQSLSLAAVAASKLGDEEKKLVKLGEVGGKRTHAMWAAGGEERNQLVEYCIDDAEKMRKIEEKTGYLELLFAIAQVTHTFPDTRCADPVRFVEGYLLKMGRARGMRFPTWHPPDPNAEREKYRGGFVMETTKTGIIRDVHVADFSGMYPSLIRTFNMSLETMGEVFRTEEPRPSYQAHLPPKKNVIPEGQCAAPNISVTSLLTVYDSQLFLNEPEGILPAFCADLMARRAYWNEEKKKHPPRSPAWYDADRRASAFKICVNSVYGVIGSIWSRFFVKQLAESVTQAGEWLIKQTMAAGEARGIRTFYGDTDSTFSTGCGEAEFARFVEWANVELYPRILKERGCTRNFINLAYEKAFDILVMMPGSKRYAGRYAHYKGKRADATSKPEIKGLEYKRGDAARLARQMQSEVIDLLLGGVDDPSRFEEIVSMYRTRILEQPIELSDVLLTKGLTKNLRDYKPKTIKKDGTPGALDPHVVIAKELARRGRDVGQGVRIGYFVKDYSTDPPTYAPAEDWNGEFDRYYVWEHTVFPATQRVLECAFPRHDWRKYERARPKKDAGTGNPALFTAGALAVPVGGAKQAPRGKTAATKKPAQTPPTTGQGSLF